MKQTGATVLLLILAACGLSAQTKRGCPAAVAGNPHGNYIIPGSLGDVAYKRGWTMDLYAPAGEPRPAAVVIHGSKGNRRGFVTRLYEHLTKAGYAWFAPDFDSDGDVLDALNFIRCPGRFNISDRVVLVGEDTGAEIALRLAARTRASGVVTVGAKLAGAAPDVTAPVLMIQGTEDEEFPITRAESFCRSLKSCRLYAEKTARHTFENWLPAQWDYREELDAWLRNGRRGLWKDIAYSRPGGRELLMDAWIPEGRGPFPAVIVAHGGGWEGGDKITYIGPLFEVLAKANVAWFSIDYSLLPYALNGQQVEEFRTAVRYVKSHANRYNVDPGRLAIFGESASGQMAMQVVSEPCEGCEVRGAICFYGVYRFATEDASQRERLARMFGADAGAEQIRRLSPFYTAHAGMPPVLIVQGSKDRLAAGSQEYAARLKELGVRTELVMLAEAPHGLENWEGHPEWAHWKAKTVEWLKSVLGF